MMSFILGVTTTPTILFLFRRQLLCRRDSVVPYIIAMPMACKRPAGLGTPGSASGHERGVIHK
ncbi:MAG: hypothetical protein IJS28_08660 [Synergistaceae bacterium]|nr:hypothetical protein [Synergistaceae bacterium]